jgi:hypothetical protein
MQVLQSAFNNALTARLANFAYALGLVTSIVFCFAWPIHIVSSRPNFWQTIVDWKTPEAYSYAGWMLSVVFFSLIGLLLVAIAVSMVYRDSFGPSQHASNSD